MLYHNKKLSIMHYFFRESKIKPRKFSPENHVMIKIFDIDI
jgi:hypothetical protein